MNGAYQHLLINHIPVVGFPLFTLVLLAGAIRKSRDVVQVGLAGLLLIAIVVYPVLKTGGGAAHVLHSYPDIARERIHEHAEAAEKGVILVIAVGVLSLIGLWLSRKPEGAPLLFVGFILLVAITASIWGGRVAHLGGLIRHPEIEEGAPGDNAMMMRMAPAGHKAQ